MAIDTVNGVPGPRRRDLRGHQPRRRIDDRKRAARRPGRGRGDRRPRPGQPARLGGARDQGARRSGSYELRDWILDHQDEIADTMQRETGKVRGEAAGESVYLIGPDQLLRQEGRKLHRRREGPRALAADEGQEAQGPVPALSRRRRDQPLELPADPLAGRRDPRPGRRCAVVIKPSEITPLGLGEIIEAWKSEIGGPDVFDVVNGMGETGSALVDEVDFVQFTGSDRTAKKVLAQRGRDAHPGERRARRQGPDDRPRERQRRAGRQRRHLGRLRQRRPGLHLRRAPLRRGARLRRVRRALHAGGRGASTRGWTAASTARTSAR